MSKERKSNIELLRIISIIIIIIHHCTVYSNFNFRAGLYPFKVIVQSLGIGGKIGSNCFILITGYFSYQKKSSLKSLKSIWVTTFLYSITIFMIFYFLGIVGLESLTKNLFPIIHSNYWFITAFFLLLIFIPYINQMIMNLDKKMYIKLLLLFFVIFSVICTFYPVGVLYNDFLWFCFLYLIGFFIHKYVDTNEIKKVYLLVCFFIVCIITILTIVQRDYSSISNPNLVGRETYFAIYNQSFLPLISSILLFLIFCSINVTFNPIVNKIAKSSFAVYIIHENYLVRPLIWKTFSKFITNNYFINFISIILFSFIVFIICTFIDVVLKYSLSLIKKRVILRVLKNKFNT